VLAEIYNTSQVLSTDYGPAFPPSNTCSINGGQPPHQIPTPSVERTSVKPESGQELVPRLRSTREVTTHADPADVFIELCIENHKSLHSVHTLSDCMTMLELFDKVATELQIYSVSRLSAEFKDDNVVRFWKCDLDKDGSQARWKQTVQLTCERQTDDVDGTIVVTVNPRNFTSLVAIDD